MNVHERMTRDVATCSPDADLAAVARILWDHDCGVVPVVDPSGRVLGLITDRDVCMAAWSRGARLLDLRAADAMSRDVVACGPDDDLARALELMGLRQVRRLPVTDPRGRIVGLISWADLAREAARSQGALSPSALVAALAMICEPRCPLPAPRKRAGAAAREDPLVARQTDLEC